MRAIFIGAIGKQCAPFLSARLASNARLAGIEPATYRLEGGCSIRLSYRRLQGRMVQL
jgi:hypothetical protein